MSQFDLQTHIRDAKTGKTIREQHYKLEVVNGQQRFERPPDSGMWYYPDGTLIDPNAVPKVEVSKEASNEKVDALLAKLAAAEAKLQEIEKKEMKQDLISTPDKKVDGKGKA